MVIQSKKVWLADQFVPAAIEVNDGRITAILPYGTKDVDDDYGDKRIVPGFMDIHCHGAYEFDTNDANEDGLRYWAEHIVSEGVTSFLATTITQSVEVLTNAVTNVANVMESGYDGAEILGIHFEGPYLDMKYKGAQPDQYIVKPTIEQFEHYQKAARGHIRYVTLATEHDEDFALTRYLTAHGVVVSIGHSGATYEQAVMAYANGARSMTHVYNGTLALTGEIGLHGQVLPVGGVEQKLAAAKEAGATKVLIPKQNWKESYHNLGIEVISVATVQELLSAAFLSEGAALSEGIDFLQEKEIG